PAGRAGKRLSSACIPFFSSIERTTRARRRIEVKVRNLRDFLPKERIGAVDPAAHLVGTKVAIGEDALDRAPAHVLCDAAPDDLLPEILDGPSRSAVAQSHRLTRQGDDFKTDDGTV